ncbi:hypothetical protein [Millisia brevis]|uniref:hypothetical protein n=1 Tax=Millisia brevis TaxID=264148 RepID=UPI00082E2510|nr:hypothetical protein [Millisia brevis]
MALIFISQTRINSANYFLASDNLRLLGWMVGVRAPRSLWVIVVAALAYVLMLTDVLSYLLQALAWQGVLVTGWVAIAIVHIVVAGRTAGERATGTAWAVAAWCISSMAGIALLVLGSGVGAQVAPVVTVVSAAGVYGIGIIAGRYRGRTAVGGGDGNPAGP